MSTNTKKCTKCGAEKPRSDFHKDPGRKDRLRADCKKCHCAARKRCYKKNREQDLKRAKEWRAAKKKWCQEQRRQYYTDHREDSAAYAANRKAHNLGCQGTLTGDDVRNTYEQYGHRCARCGTTENLSIDHVKPLVKGGPNTRDNLQILCLSCNKKKHDKEIRFTPYQEGAEERRADVPMDEQ